ncbi:MAG TPA: hemolysin family protein [Candidatus Anaerobutyricum stercoris]|uniref:Hemolysin family protein n=1 Tax=Candidatus Anaerobutyricum stercoris TaxID=2838457 RepID=A0A9D2ENX7_9FIRM|nr:Magnesium and cobalt efflux protein CorC [Eubacteriaceae bacterium CHKCI004]HIZ40810.1 hemolysin family protein [Candidatus Anaerobutyricum stercoris]
MEDSIIFLLLVQVILIALNAIFASAEIAVLSVKETKLEKMAEEGNKKAIRLTHLTSEPSKFLSTIQVAITLSGFLGSAFAADNFSDPLVEFLIGLGIGIPRSTLNTLSVVVITLILSYFTLIFGELVPKRIAMKKSEQLALAISGLVSAISTLFKPIVWFLSLSTNAILRLCGIDPTETDDAVSEEEIRMMVDAGSEKGAIDYEEKEFIQNVFEFDDLMAGEIATHRTDVTILFLEDSDEEWEQIIHDSRHTLYPVCDNSPDQVVGILNAKDYFRLSDKTRQSVLEGAVRPAYFVPETVKADVLFRNMKQGHHSLAVILDEYGGMVGIVTLNDLIEELVGELSEDIPDFGSSDPQIEQQTDSSWEINGNIPLDEIKEETGIDLENDDYDTLGGLVFDILGLIPQDGPQNIDLEVAQLHIHVSYIKDHQIEKATIERIELPEETPEESESTNDTKDTKAKDNKSKDTKAKDTKTK